MDNVKITKVAGRALPLRGNDIDTDRIIPARFLRCVTFDGLGEHAFEDDRRQNPEHPFNQARYQGAAVLLVGGNFGCGSSREHAPQSLYKWGIRAIVGVSFAEIFYGNCNAMGVPVVRVTEAESEALFRAVETDPALECLVDVSSATVTLGNLRIQGDIPRGVRDSLLSGAWNATAGLLEAGEKIERIANALPYTSGFPQMASVSEILQADAVDRYEYFIEYAVSHNELWLLRNAEGFATIADGALPPAIPVWPHSELAASHALGDWADCTPCAVALPAFLKEWLPGMKQEGRNLVVLPVPGATSVFIEADRLLHDFKAELSGDE